MLSLKKITKNYMMGDTTVEALKGVSVDFRKSEFVSVLGQSGCGKTTLLNIIGGLDRYTSGDLIIDGVSTKKYRDRDWDTYRNHRIGFVFQSYNLIPHQTVLSNVELALTLSGVSKSERRKRAIDVLEKVGLKDQLHKKPNQMSGGQIQRVAIARALINDPDILLADEPTGALDSETSVNIMEILKEISKDKLIIMVTHNPELAEKYSTRIIKLKDGLITGDSNPFTEDTPVKEKPEKIKKTSMSFFTALSLSLNNLMTKKGRTILTAFAGSIGIIGIALILSLSNGVQIYIDDIQHDTLASYPLTIDESNTDISAFLSTSRANAIAQAAEERPADKIYTDNRMGDLFENMYADTNINDLKSFKEFLDGNEEVGKYVSNIAYSYGMELQVFRELEDDTIKQVNPNTVLDDIGFGSVAGIFSLRSQVMSSAQNINVFSEITDNDEMFDTRYELVAGEKPDSFDEAVLMIDRNNEITDFTLYALGMRDTEGIRNSIREMMQKKDKSEIEKLDEGENFEYDDFLGMTFSVIPNPELYSKNDESGIWENMTGDPSFMKDAYDDGVKLTIVGIVREKERSAQISGMIGYTRALTEKLSEMINKSEIVKEQQTNEQYDVFTGLPFADTEAGDKAEAEAKAEAERRKREFEEMQEKMAKAAEQMNELKKVMEEYTASIPDIKTIFSTLTPVERLTLMQMSSEEQREYVLKLYPMPELPDISAVIELLPADDREKFRGMEKEEQLQYLMSLGETYQTSAPSAGNTADVDISSMNMSEISDEQMQYFMSLSEEERENIMKRFGMTSATSGVVSTSNKYDNLKALGVIDLATPSSISIYPTDFEAKERIVDIIAEYNRNHDEVHQISYTDIVGMLMSSVTDIINAISYILIAFVAISLIVSSIMIGIITYISVLERTKEIGILRSIGASKHDISRVFNAETIIIGLFSGLIGIGVTLLLLIPINIIIENITNIADLAVLPPVGAVALIVISVILTLIAGILPSRVAAKKDPVIALRTE